MWKSCLYGSERAWVATESVCASRERPFYSNSGGGETKPVEIMDKNEQRKLRANIQNLKTNGKAIYKKQNAEREAFLKAPENQKKISEIKASLKAAHLICKMRKRARLTQAQIAVKLGIKQPNYARIERGQNVTVNTNFRI